jgi:hypothetical protein
MVGDDRAKTGLRNGIEKRMFQRWKKVFLHKSAPQREGGANFSKEKSATEKKNFQPFLVHIHGWFQFFRHL